MESRELEMDEDEVLIVGSENRFAISTFQETENLSRCLLALKTICNKIGNLYIAANTKLLTAIIILLLVIGSNVALFFVAVLTHPVQIDYSLRAFEVPGHQESKKLDSLIAARDDVYRSAKEDQDKRHGRLRRAGDNPEVVIHSQYQRQWRLELVYLASDDNIFTENKLQYIHNVEKNLMKHEKFQNFCWKSKDALKDKTLVENFKGCMPPNSLIDYFYRTDYFDGQALELSNIQETIDYLLTKVSTFWYVDDKFDAKYRKSKYLRSQLHFGVPLPGYSDSEDSLKEQHEIFRKFLVDYVKQLETSSSAQVTVLYGSPEIYDYEIKHTFFHDVLFAAISFGLIVVLLFILTSFSLWLTIFGLLTIVFSVPFSYFVYRVLLRIDTIGILTGTTVFVIIGIGVDDVFVFINVFRAATHLKDIRERMKHLIVTAGKATFFTSFTTAAAFGANALTKVPAVHDFGLFTCILVMSCWLMVVLLMPPCLFLWHKWFIKCEMCLCFNKCCKKVVGDVQMDSLVTNDHLEMNFNGQQMAELNEGQNIEEDNDIVGISGEASQKDTDCCTVTNLLTKLMDNFIAKPVLKYRYVVLAIYLIITGLSVVAITHLKTASGRPELFPANTNLQRLLNLEFNFSSSYIDCSSCSGDLKRVPRGPRARRYSEFRLPVRRSIDGLEFSMNGTRGLNGSELHRSKSDFMAAAKTTASSPMTDITKNMTGGNKDINSGTEAKYSSAAASAHEAATTLSTKATAAATTKTTATTRKATNTATSTTLKMITKKGESSKNSSSSLPHTPGFGLTVAAKDIMNESSIPTSPKANTRLPSNTSNAATAATRPVSLYNGSTTQPVTSKTIRSTIKSEVSKSDVQSQTNDERKYTTHAAVTQQPHSTKAPSLCPKPCTPVKRPIVDITAIVFVVFGVKGIKRNANNGKHFFGTNKGIPIYDEKFTMVGSQLQVVATGALVKTFCRICLAFQNNTELVQRGGADCFPRQVYRQLKLFKYDECQALVEPQYTNGRLSMSGIGVIHNKIKWMTMAFESTTYKGSSAFDLKRDYEKWENFTRSLLSAPDVPEMLKSGYQTSDTWVNMFSEIIAVNGAVYGITLSLVLCLAAVVIFTANWRLSFIVFMTIAGALCLVVAVFWMAGWTLGAIEAISLSILVGTSVDYTVHLTEGYIMANKMAEFEGFSKMESRREHTRMALNHIGVSIFSSALTTLIAAIPLCLTQIQLFSKFGQILAINTGMSIFYTLTICVSLLSIMGPNRFKGSMKYHCLALIVVALFVGLVFLLLYLLNMYANVSVPGPTGGQLFQ